MSSFRAIALSFTLFTATAVGLKFIKSAEKGIQDLTASASNVNNETKKEDKLTKILPLVTFDCSGRTEGYYADVDFNCEAFHYCKPNGERFTFVCPPKSRFNQKHMVCDYDRYGMKLCHTAEKYFNLNENLYPKREDEKGLNSTYIKPKQTVKSKLAALSEKTKATQSENKIKLSFNPKNKTDELKKTYIVTEYYNNYVLSTTQSPLTGDGSPSVYKWYSYTPSYEDDEKSIQKDEYPEDYFEYELDDDHPEDKSSESRHQLEYPEDRQASKAYSYPTTKNESYEKTTPSPTESTTKRTTKDNTSLYNKNNVKNKEISSTEKSTSEEHTKNYDSNESEESNESTEKQDYRKNLNENIKHLIKQLASKTKAPRKKQTDDYPRRNNHYTQQSENEEKLHSPKSNDNIQREIINNKNHKNDYKQIKNTNLQNDDYPEDYEDDYVEVNQEPEKQPESNDKRIVIGRPAKIQDKNYNQNRQIDYDYDDQYNKEKTPDHSKQDHQIPKQVDYNEKDEIMNSRPKDENTRVTKFYHRVTKQEEQPVKTVVYNEENLNPTHQKQPVYDYTESQENSRENEDNKNVRINADDSVEEYEEVIIVNNRPERIRIYRPISKNENPHRSREVNHQRLPEPKPVQKIVYQQPTMVKSYPIIPRDQLPNESPYNPRDTLIYNENQRNPALFSNKNPPKNMPVSDQGRYHNTEVKEEHVENSPHVVYYNRPELSVVVNSAKPPNNYKIINEKHHQLPYPAKQAQIIQIERLRELRQQPLERRPLDQQILIQSQNNPNINNNRHQNIPEQRQIYYQPRERYQAIPRQTQMHYNDPDPDENRPRQRQHQNQYVVSAPQDHLIHTIVPENHQMHHRQGEINNHQTQYYPIDRRIMQNQQKNKFRSRRQKRQASLPLSEQFQTLLKKLYPPVESASTTQFNNFQNFVRNSFPSETNTRPEHVRLPNYSPQSFSYPSTNLLANSASSRDGPVYGQYPANEDFLYRPTTYHQSPEYPYVDSVYNNYRDLDRHRFQNPSHFQENSAERKPPLTNDDKEEIPVSTSNENKKDLPEPANPYQSDYRPNNNHPQSFPNLEEFPFFNPNYEYPKEDPASRNQHSSRSPYPRINPQTYQVPDLGVYFDPYGQFSLTPLYETTQSSLDLNNNTFSADFLTHENISDVSDKQQYNDISNSTSRVSDGRRLPRNRFQNDIRKPYDVTLPPELLEKEYSTYPPFSFFVTPPPFVRNNNRISSVYGPDFFPPPFRPPITEKPESTTTEDESFESTTHSPENLVSHPTEGLKPLRQHIPEPSTLPPRSRPENSIPTRQSSSGRQRTRQRLRTSSRPQTEQSRYRVRQELDSNQVNIQPQSHLPRTLTTYRPRLIVTTHRSRSSVATPRPRPTITTHRPRPVTTPKPISSTDSTDDDVNPFRGSVPFGTRIRRPAGTSVSRKRRVYQPSASGQSNVRTNAPAGLPHINVHMEKRNHQPRRATNQFKEDISESTPYVTPTVFPTEETPVVKNVNRYLNTEKDPLVHTITTNEKKLPEARSNVRRASYFYNNDNINNNRFRGKEAVATPKNNNQEKKSHETITEPNNNNNQEKEQQEVTTQSNNNEEKKPRIFVTSYRNNNQEKQPHRLPTVRNNQTKEIPRRIVARKRKPKDHPRRDKTATTESLPSSPPTTSTTTTSTTTSPTTTTTATTTTTKAPLISTEITSQNITEEASTEDNSGKRVYTSRHGGSLRNQNVINRLKQKPRLFTFGRPRTDSS